MLDFFLFFFGCGIIDPCYISCFFYFLDPAFYYFFKKKNTELAGQRIVHPSSALFRILTFHASAAHFFFFLKIGFYIFKKGEGGISAIKSRCFPFAVFQQKAEWLNSRIMQISIIPDGSCYVPPFYIQFDIELWAPLKDVTEAMF